MGENINFQLVLLLRVLSIVSSGFYLLRRSEARIAVISHSPSWGGPRMVSVAKKRLSDVSKSPFLAGARVTRYKSFGHFIKRVFACTSERHSMQRDLLVAHAEKYKSYENKIMLPRWTSNMKFQLFPIQNYSLRPNNSFATEKHAKFMYNFLPQII